MIVMNLIKRHMDVKQLGTILSSLITYPKIKSGDFLMDYFNGRRK